MDYSPPGTSVHGIFQGRILEWVATPSSRGSSQSKDQTDISYITYIAGGFFTSELLEKPISMYNSIDQVFEVLKVLFLLWVLEA